MLYRATEAGLVLVEREPSRVAAPELWIPQEGSIWDLPPLGAFGVAGAFGTTMMASGSGLSPLELFGARCKQWVKAEVGALLDTNLFGIGSSPPAVTISGQPASPIEFYVEISGAGSLGAATYRYSAQGASGWIESGLTTAATHVCIGAATGITLHFPAGSYATSHAYKGIIATWQDQSGNGNDYTQSNSNVAPFYRYNALGGVYPTVFFQATEYMTCASLILGTGNDTAFTVFLEAQILQLTGNGVLFGMGSTTAANPLYDIQADITGAQFGFSKRDDAGVTKTCAGGAPNGSRHYISLVNNGTTQSLYIDGSQVSLSSSGDLNVGVTTMDRMTLCARLQASATVPLAANVSEVWGISGAASADELASSHGYFAAKYV